MARKNKSQKKVRKPKRQKPSMRLVQRELRVIDWFIAMLGDLADKTYDLLPASEQDSFEDTINWLAAGRRPRPKDWTTVMRCLAVLDSSTDKFSTELKLTVIEATVQQRHLTAADAFALDDMTAAEVDKLVEEHGEETVELASNLVSPGEPFDAAIERAHLILDGHRP